MENKEVVKEAEIKETLKMLLGEIEGLKKDRDILMQSADKKALARYYARNKEDMPPIVRLRTMNVYNKETKKTETKLVVGWKTIEDLGSFQVPGTGKWTESQTIEIIYQDGSSEKMALMEWNRRYEKHIKAKVIGVITDNRTGIESLKLARLDPGEDLVISVQYVN